MKLPQVAIALFLSSYHLKIIKKITYDDKYHDKISKKQKH